MDSRVEDKLDRLLEAVAKLQQTDADQRVNIEKFWGKDWPRVINQIDTNAVKIAALEVEVAQLKTKVFVWGTLLAIGFTAITQLLPIFLAK